MLHRSWRAVLFVFLSILSVLGGMFLLAPSAQAATFTVTSLADSGAGSLRQAISDANATPAADTIIFGISGTITLASSLPDITTAITIDGTGRSVTLSGNNAVRILRVLTNGNLTLKRLTLRNGNGVDVGSAVDVSNAALTVYDTTFSNNNATVQGGAVHWFSSAVSIYRSTFSGNTAPTGGAIYSNMANGLVIIENTTFSGNSATTNGGAIFNVNANILLFNATLSGNSSTNNPNSGGIYSFPNLGSVTVNGSIIHNSPCNGTAVTGANNVMFPAACANAQGVVAEPLLGALASNGGTTRTHLLLPGSPAINTLTIYCPTTDQRGIERPQGAACDVGAVEYIAQLRLIAPTGTISTPYGNPTYQWSSINATFYDLAVFNSSGGLMLYAPYLSGSQHCIGDVCAFDPTVNLTYGENARLNNGSYTIYLKAAGGDWLGPFAFTLNAPPPDAVTMSAPEGLDTLRPTLNWTLANNATAIRAFRLYLIPKALFDAGIYTPTLDQWFTRAERCLSTVSAICLFQPTFDLQDDTAYYLFVQGYGPGGYTVGGQYNNGWSGVEFRVDTIADPPLPDNLQVSLNQGHPTISWDESQTATQYHLVIFNWTTNTWVYNQWHNSAGLCSGNTCTALLQVGLANGSYSVFIAAQGEGGLSSGGLFGNGYNGPVDSVNLTEAGDFVLDSPVPALVDDLNAFISSGEITVRWTSPVGATWYRVWLGTAGAAQTYTFQTLSSVVLGCPEVGQSCTFSAPASSFAVPAGTTLYAAVQSIGPGGFATTGGLVGNGYQVSDPFTLP
jgi:hypothetical protein